MRVLLPINNQWPIKAIIVLSTEMGMIPAGSKRLRSKLICETTSRGNWALRNGGYTIRPRTQLLRLTMPMKTQPFVSIISNVISDSDAYRVSPICFDKRSGKLIIYENNTLLISIWCFGRSGYCEIIVPGLSSVGWEVWSWLGISPRVSVI